MKRSEINQAIEYAMELLEREHLRLPAFGYWNWEEWRAHRTELDNLRAVQLGWDVTDFGSGRFMQRGSVLFTVRNGSKADPHMGTPYAEKLIVQRQEEEQEIPFHFHTEKTEDIINRGGGILCLELFNAKGTELDTETPVRVRMDGIEHTVAPGARIEVEKGCSITLTPGLYHRFYAKKGAGDLVIGEVSSVNDDERDNSFFESLPRFAAIEEDETARYPLCNEYGRL